MVAKATKCFWVHPLSEPFVTWSRVRQETSSQLGIIIAGFVCWNATCTFELLVNAKNKILVLPTYPHYQIPLNDEHCNSKLPADVLPTEAR